MKTTLIITLIVLAALGYCVKLAKDNKEANRLPDVLPGTTYTITKDKFEQIGNRYELNVELNNMCNEREVKEISEWIARTHKQSETFIIFYYLPGERSAWARVDLPNYKFETMPETY